MDGKVKFTKMQGIGNDYIYINGFEEQILNPAALAVKISDRHFGVGGDGLVMILPSATADLRMRIFNADGSEAEMCGNAARCVGKFAYDNDLFKKSIIRLETGAGIKVIHLLFEGGAVIGATVDMGQPVLAVADIPLAPCGDLADPENEQRFIGRPLSVAGQEWTVTAVSMGNPHAVVFQKNIDELPLSEIGPLFETHMLFPNRTNTEFVEVLSRTRIRMRVWERGSGETLACGTGACAAVVACILNGFTERQVDVELPGGILHINWDEAGGHVYMSGPAVTVFAGEYYIF